MPQLRNGPQLLVNFRVTTWVSSIDPHTQQRKDTDRVDSRTQGGIHVIHVENTTSVPRDCRVVGKLPNGLTFLSFDDGGIIKDEWSKDIPNMKDANDPHERHCDLRHVSEAFVLEPVRCEEVYSKYGNGSWVPETGLIPLAVNIAVQK
jgi:hypothetical protein